MSNLGAWLRNEIERRRLTQAQIAVYAGVGQATISAILHRGHIPKVETLFRLADALQTPREQILRLAGHLAHAPEPESASEEAQADPMIQALLDEFRQVPPAWQEEAIAQVALFARLAQRPAMRLIGEEALDGDLGAATAEGAAEGAASPETEDGHEAGSDAQAA
jgi:transcriptional regulator with XRE-family HTH domain